MARGWRRASATLTLFVACTGCVRDAVLENDVRNAQWKARTLATATDLEIAEAALSAELVELEALYQRAPTEPRVLELLASGYARMALGFIEARRLEAIVSTDTAQATHQAERRSAALARAAFYANAAGQKSRALGKQPRILALTLSQAEAACRSRNRADYEARLSALLATPDSSPELRLDNALTRRLARSWLKPAVRARCSF